MNTWALRLDLYHLSALMTIGTKHRVMWAHLDVGKLTYGIRIEGWRDTFRQM